MGVDAVRRAKGPCLIQMFVRNGLCIGKRCDGASRSQGGDSRAQTFDVQAVCDFSIFCVKRVGYLDIWKEVTSGVDAFNESRFVRGPFREKRNGIIIKGEAAPAGLGPLGRRRGWGDVDSVRESVGKLRAQVTFLGIHASNENETSV